MVAGCSEIPFDLMTRGLIAEKPPDDDSVRGGGAPRGRFHQQLAAVAGDEGPFDRGAEDNVLRVCQQDVQATSMLFAIAWADNRLGQVTAERLVAPPAEDPGGGVVPLNDRSCFVDQDERVAGGLDDLPDLFLVDVAAGDVTGDHRGADDRAAAVVDR